MRISLTHRLIFLANPRCASTSLRRALDPFCEIKGASDGKPLAHHACLKSVERHLMEIGEGGLDGFFIFTTLRNPWDRVVSIYHYGLSNPASIWHAPASAAGSVSAFCFDPILDWVFSPQAGHPEGPFDIVSFTSDLSGKRRSAVFDVGDLTRLEQALADRGLDIRAPHINASKRGHYRPYFDERAAARVGELFAVDVAEGGYAF